jgi:hypothetical protein
LTPSEQLDYYISIHDSASAYPMHIWIVLFQNTGWLQSSLRLGRSELLCGEDTEVSPF